jgi:hypothetical protein
MTRPRSGLYYVDEVDGMVHLPDLTVFETELMQPIGFLHGTIIVQVPDRPKRIRKPKPKPRAKARPKRRAR